MFKDFLETTKNELESFDPFNAFFSFEDNVTKIYTFTVADSYFVLFTDLLTNSKSDLLKIFEFFELRVYKMEGLFQNSEDLFQNSEDNRDSRGFKSALLHDLNLLAYVNETGPYRDDSVEKLNIFIEEFLNEAQKYYMSDNEGIGSLINNSLLKKVNHLTLNTAIPFILVSGLLAIYVSILKQPERYSYVSFSSSSPFAMIQPFSYTSRQLSSTKQTLESSVITTVQLPRQATTVTNETNKSLKLYERSVQRQAVRNIEAARRRNLIGSTKALVPSSKRIQISQNDGFYQEANKLLEKVNILVDKMKHNNRVVRPQLNFGLNPDGTLNGKVNIINSAGMHSSILELREGIGKIIKTNNLKLTFVNKNQESDHFKTSTQRAAYKFVSKVDTGMAVVRPREAHAVKTNWASTTNSRLDPDGKLIPELSYEQRITPNLLIDYEDAAQFEATKSFLQARYSISPGTDKLIMLDNNTNVSGFSGEELLELEGSSGAEVFKAEELVSQLTRLQITKKMSCNGENSGMEQQLVADSRVFRDGHAGACSTYNGFDSAKQAETTLDVLGTNTIDAIVFMENAKAICKPGGPAFNEISGLISQVKNNFTTTVTENIHTVENFKVSENKIRSFTEPTLPKDQTSSDLDQLGVKNRVFEQDKNRTGAFHNSRKEIGAIKNFPELQNHPLVQATLEIKKD